MIYSADEFSDGSGNFQLLSENSRCANVPHILVGVERQFTDRLISIEISRPTGQQLARPTARTLATRPPSRPPKLCPKIAQRYPAV